MPTRQSSDLIAQAKKLYAKVDPYQPLYGLGDDIASLRPTADRCKVIYDYLDRDVRSKRMLDVGCNVGYVSCFLAEHGANVTGWDYSTDNIAVCNAVMQLNDLQVEFATKTLSKETVAAIKPGAYDVVIILSVLHWTVHEHGLAYVQDCMSELLAKVPLVIVELAQKDELPGLGIYDDAPANDLSIFKDTDGLNIQKIAEFGTHQKTKVRPLYAVSAK